MHDDCFLNVFNSLSTKQNFPCYFSRSLFSPLLKYRLRCFCALPQHRLDSTSSDVQGFLIKSCLRLIPLYLEERLKVPNKGGRTDPLPQSNKHWKRYKDKVKTFLKSVLALQTSNTDVNTLVFAMHCSMPLCPYFACKLLCVCLPSLYRNDFNF